MSLGLSLWGGQLCTPEPGTIRPTCAVIPGDGSMSFMPETGRCGTAARRNPDSPTAFAWTAGSCGTAEISLKERSGTTCEITLAWGGCLGFFTHQTPARMQPPYGWASGRGQSLIFTQRAATG